MVKKEFFFISDPVISKRKKNYIGKYSAYFWLLEIKLDIPQSHDMHEETVIEIV